MATALTRWEPFSDMAEMRGRLDQVMADLNPLGSHQFMPAMDVIRSNGNLIVKADLPGMTAKDVKIEIEDDVMTLHGKHSEEHEQKGSHFVRRERRWGTFSRSLPLPSGVDATKIEARTHDGVLDVTVPLPKSETHKPVTITPKAD